MSSIARAILNTASKVHTSHILKHTTSTSNKEATGFFQILVWNQTFYFQNSTITHIPSTTHIIQVYLHMMETRTNIERSSMFYIFISIWIILFSFYLYFYSIFFYLFTPWQDTTIFEVPNPKVNFSDIYLLNFYPISRDGILAWHLSYGECLYLLILVIN